MSLRTAVSSATVSCGHLQGSLCRARLVYSQGETKQVVGHESTEGSSTATASFTLPSCATFLEKQWYGHQCSK